MQPPDVPVEYSKKTLPLLSVAETPATAFGPLVCLDEMSNLKVHQRNFWQE